MGQASGKPRGRDLGLPFPGETGPLNALTDVPGVAVGFATLVAGSGPRQVRTGVTAVVPRAGEAGLAPAWAGFHAFNGNGEMTGTHWIEEAGYFQGPVCLTNTHSVGIVHHAAVRWMVRRHAREFAENHLWAMPVVAETYDGVLNDINGQHVTEADALKALDGARAGVPLAEGNVGGGTGMIAYGFKGGTGTSSRRVAVAGGRAGTVGTLVQANHGVRDWLTVLGVPVGRHLREGDGEPPPGREGGSVIAVVGTDLPLLPAQLRRLAKRAALGVGRGGTAGGNGSGDLFLAFGVGNRVELPQRGAPAWALEAVNDELLDPVFEAAVQAVEEAVVNAMLAAEAMAAARPPGRVVRAIDHGALCQVMRAHGRLGPAPT